MNIYYFIFIGYLLILIVSFYHIIENYSIKDYGKFIGFIIMFIGYLFLLIKNYNKLKKHHENNYSHAILSKNNNYKFPYNYLVLFYFINIWYEIIEPNLIINYIALFGYLLLIKNNKFKEYGYILITIYYLFMIYYYLFQNIDTNIFSYIKVLGCFFVIIFYCFVFIKFFKKNLMNTN